MFNQVNGPSNLSNVLFLEMDTERAIDSQSNTDISYVDTMLNEDVNIIISLKQEDECEDSEENDNNYEGFTNSEGDENTDDSVFN